MYKIIKILSLCVKNKIGVQPLTCTQNYYILVHGWWELGEEAKTRVCYFCFFRFADMALSASMAA